MSDVLFLLPLQVVGSGVMPAEPNQNIAVSLALAGLAFVVTTIIGRPIITYLRQQKIGKQIRVDGPRTHLVKTGTPTMGGIMISISVIVVTLVFNTAGRLSMLLPVTVLLACTILGGFDDRMSLVGGSKGGGMSARAKMVGLAVVGAVAALVLHLPFPFGLGLHNIYIPFIGQFDLGWVYVPIAALAIIGTANAVNVTDGLDTQCGGTAAIAFCAYGIVAYRQGQLGVVTFCFIMVGALMGFLWFNAHPAQVFMGDTGSLALGGALGAIAILLKSEFLLLIVGGVFVAETMSVILQRTVFKYRRRRFGLEYAQKHRLFRRAPLHHHFEVKGWPETQVVVRFWILGILCAFLALSTLKLR